MNEPEGVICRLQVARCRLYHYYALMHSYVQALNVFHPQCYMNRQIFYWGFLYFLSSLQSFFVLIMIPFCGYFLRICFPMYCKWNKKSYYPFLLVSIFTNVFRKIIQFQSTVHRVTCKIKKRGRRLTLRNPFSLCMLLFYSLSCRICVAQFLFSEVYDSFVHSLILVLLH